MNLDALTPEVLTELTNAGTVRRAVKDASVELTWSRTADGAWLAEAADGTRCRLGVGTFDEWECTCPAMFRCRHLVRAVLAWRREHPGDAVSGEPASGQHPATGPAAASTSPPAPASAPGGLGTADLVFSSRVLAQGERLVAAGITARVTAVPRLRVRLLHPVDIGVRYPVGGDARYARCECGVPGCVHLYLAEAARALAAPRLGSADAVLVDAAPAGADRVDPATWHAWLDQLLNLGLGAADALIGGAVRLATDWEQQGRVHVASSLREIVTQLEHQRARDAQLSPERLLLLIGEVEARLRALAHDGPAPAALVAGRPDAEQTGEAGRFVGLGAAWSHVGGWNSLRVGLLDTRTGAVASLVAEREDTTEHLVEPADLLAVRRAGVPLGDWATGNALVPRFRRRGADLTLGRTRITVAPAPRLDLDALAAVIPDGFAEVEAQLSGVPGPLGPRRPTDGLVLARVAGAGEVRADPATGTVTATLTDPGGSTAAVRLAWGPRTVSGARRLVTLLHDLPPLAVAGRWRAGEQGLEVEPTALWVAEGVFLPQVDLAQGCDPVEAPQWPPAGADPWRDAWEAVSQPLGRLLVLGALRGADTVAPQLTWAQQRAESAGLTRLAALAGRLRGSLWEAQARRLAFSDACVVLAFAS